MLKGFIILKVMEKGNTNGFVVFVAEWVSQRLYLSWSSAVVDANFARVPSLSAGAEW